MELRVEDGKRDNDDFQEQISMLERRETVLSCEINELRVSLEQAEKNRKMAENELLECRYIAIDII